MPISHHDRRILRELTEQVATIATLPEQAEKSRLWLACNDLRAERAMVFADPQGGWAEIDAAWLRSECDPPLRWIEDALRRKIIRHLHIPSAWSRTASRGGRRWRNGWPSKRPNSTSSALLI